MESIYAHHLVRYYRIYMMVDTEAHLVVPYPDEGFGRWKGSANK